jgi:RNA polymerase sigma-70 factor, ECF subfamily
MLAALPPDQAEAVALRVIGELSVADVAEVMGRREGHVRVLVHRGLRRLAAQVGVTPGIAPTMNAAS